MSDAPTPRELTEFAHMAKALSERIIGASYITPPAARFALALGVAATHFLANADRACGNADCPCARTG